MTSLQTKNILSLAAEKSQNMAYKEEKRREYREEKLLGGHKPGRDGKPGKLGEFEKLSKSQGNLNFCRKNLENSGKMKNYQHLRKI